MDTDELLHISGPLKQRIVDNMKGFEVVSADRRESADNSHAAVAVVVVDVANDQGVYGMSPTGISSEESALILTRRNSGLNSHAGQWALPGGRMDPGETPEITALRELAEEVDLHLSPGDIIGRLDDYVTRSGFVITPVVIWGGKQPILTPNPDEVRSIHRIPIRELLREDAPLLDSIPESENPVLLMPIGQSWIASPTGAILYQFREVSILGKPTRVAHFEQPYFAWS